MAKSEETIFNLPQYRDRRADLRKNPTEPEKRFWQAVRGKQLGVKFRRQHGIGHYIVDFYCPEWQLVAVWLRSPMAALKTSTPQN